MTRQARSTVRALPQASSVDRLAVPGVRSAGETRLKSERLDSVDLLRGVIIALMALDHVRGFFTDFHFDPTDLTRTTAALFATRWITHFCAPGFFLLAGAGAWLSRTRGRTTADLAKYLLTRGLFLVVLDNTLVMYGWFFTVRYPFGVGVNVIAALGLSMVALAGLVFLPRGVVAGFGIGMIILHHLVDGFEPGALGGLAPVWWVLHGHGFFAVAGLKAFVVYPLVPWIGVMAAGYALGPILLREPASRRRILLSLGLACTLLFVLLRAINLYGDPTPWRQQASVMFTFLSFLGTTKYPPSLLFLLMTLGPAIAALAWLERARGPLTRFLITFGRVPLFFYVVHIYVVHLAALTVGPALLFNPDGSLPEGLGLGLPAVYGIWALAVLALYPLCRWFAGFKRRRQGGWLSYL
jgi:uncharacterized membrane protein